MQSWHVADDVAAVAALNLPATQSWQTLCPVPLYVPVPHDVHTAAEDALLTVLEVPALHGWQLGWPLTL